MINELRGMSPNWGAGGYFRLTIMVRMVRKIMTVAGY